MARYNAVQIGAVYLTSTGAAGGSPCKLDVKGLGALETTKTGQILISANGTPYAQLISVTHRGLPISIQAEWMAKAVYDSIVAIFEAAKNAASSIAIVVNGDTGDYSFNAIPAVPDDIDHDSFRNGYIKSPVFRLTIT